MASGIELPLLLAVGGLVLVVMEALAPGAHFAPLGIAVFLAGAVGLVFGPLAGPLALALMVLVFGAAAIYAYHEFDIYGGKGAGQTSDSSDLTGKTGRATERVTPDGGMVRLQDAGFDPNYRARSMDGTIEVGTEVIVTDPGGGNVLTVDSLDAGMDDIDRELARERDRTDDATNNAPDERATRERDTESAS